MREDYPVYQRYGLPSTNSAEAFRYFIYGNQAASRVENARAIDWYIKALEADSNYFEPMIGLSSVYGREGDLEKDYQWVIRYYKKRNQFSFADQLRASWAYAYSFEPLEIAVKYLEQLKQLDDQKPYTYYILGIIYNQMGQYEKAIVELEKNLSICKKWGKDFMKNNSMYTELGLAYHKTGQFAKEKKLYKLGEKNMPDDGPIAANQAILYLSENDTITARKYINKFIGLHKTRYQSPPAHVTRRLAEIYQGAGQLDKAEELFRKSLSLEPENPERMVIISNFFIETNKNLNEVPELMDKAMTLARNKHDYYNYFETKGWSLYKMGRYKEALEILEKTWNEAPFRLYKIYEHLEVARIAAETNLHN